MTLVYLVHVCPTGFWQVFHVRLAKNLPKMPGTEELLVSDGEASSTASLGLAIPAESGSHSLPRFVTPSAEQAAAPDHQSAI